MNATEDCNDEDLEDGEIFDDDENESEAVAAASANAGSQKSVVANNSTTGAVQNNSITSDNGSDNKNKDNAVPDSTTAFSKIATPAAAASSCGNNNLKSESQSGYVPPWKTSNGNVLSGSDNAAKKINSFQEEDNHKRSNREKKKKRKRLKNGDDDKHIKEKRAKRSSDKDGLGDSNHNDPPGENLQPPPEDEDMEDDDDEMLFIRGASPTMQQYNKRHHRGSRDEDDDRLQDDEDEDFMDDEDNDFEDEDDEENGERRRRSNDLPGGVDRAARRERLSARGKRRGRGGANRDGNSKRRKDDSEICIFYLQGKCHKGGECPFSHDAMPHKKMELCKFYLMDCCNKKDKCLYMHSEFPCKYFHMGLKCYANKNCKFSHAKLSDGMRQVFIKTFGPVNSRGNKDFPNKKGSSSKHRQDGDFPRGGPNRDGGRRGSEAGNKRNGPGNGSGGPEKKIPSLFDIKVSIPTEMRNNADNNNHSDSDGNHTPMPSPTHMQNMSDSSRSPPPPSTSQRRRQKKERKREKSKKSDGHRGERNENISNNNKRIPLMLMNNDTNWDEMMLEHQRMQQQMLAELAAGNFADDSDHNDEEDDRHCNNNDQFFGSQHDNYNSNSNNSNSSCNNNKSNNLDPLDGGFNDTLMSSQCSQSPQNDSDTGGGLQIATQSNDSSNEMFPAHLPKKQRELFLRIKQQQRQASDSGSNGGGRLQIAEDGCDESNENSGNPASDKTDSSISLNIDDKNKMDDDDYDNKSKQHDENWYSSDEEDEQQQQQPSGGTSSLNAILQNLVRLNSSNTGNLSPSSLMNSQTSVNSIFSSIQPAAVTSSVTSSVAESSVSSSTSSGGGVNSLSTSGITNVDFDINEVSALLSKVKEHFQSNNEKKTVRDPRLSRSDVGPNGDSPSSMSTNSVSTTVVNSFPASLSVNQNTMPSTTLGNEDVDLRLNAGNRSAGAGDMDLRNLPFKPAPVHSAATEIDASINSHSPLPYRLIPAIVAKPDYSSIQPNSKVGAADPRLRKSLRVSEESSSVVSSRDPRHRLIDNINKEKTTVPPPAVQNSDPRQRARIGQPAGIPNMIPTTMAEELQLPPSLMLSQLRSGFPMMSGPGPDMGMMCPPTPRSDDEPPPNFMGPMPTRPSDPRQRPMQMNLPPAGQIPQTLFDALNAMQNIRQPNFLSQTGDPRTRPPGVPNMPNVVFPGTVRSNDPVVRGQFNFK